jgi:hypothetical protein
MYTSVSTHWSSLGVYQANAFITKGKQRLKQFGHKVHLSDKDSFEIELFNPNKIKILAKIQLNGSYISGGGIILNPGQRVFLERFIDSAKLMTFNTYTVNGNDAEALEAIANNGKVEIQFYAEKQSDSFSTGNYIYSNPFTHINPYPYTVDFNTTTGHTNVNTTLSSPSGNMRGVETGRIEKGAESEQKVKSVYGEFELFWFDKIKWHIMSKDEKPLEKEELNLLYCGECGAKRKKSTHKFCPHCGTAF